MPAAHTTSNTHGLARVQRWENVTAWPLFAGSLLFFACLTLSWVDPHPSPIVRSVSGLAIAGLWVWFIVDYISRLILAGRDRKQFFVSRSFDLASIVLPCFRPFLILVTIWRLPVFARGDAQKQRIRFGLVTLLFAFLYVYVNSYLVWAAEKGDPRANIVNFEDAVWWGFTTITTVGYGDYTPITTLGRILAISLMLGGILVLGVTTATVLSYVTDRIRTIAIPDRGARGRDRTDEAESTAEADGN